MIDSKKVWERALKSELGPTLTWLLDEMTNATFQSKSEDFFLLDPPTSSRLTSTAQQTKLGLFVLGRTPRGLFGVERTGDAPLDARPVFSAPFNGPERTIAAPNLALFLRALEGFEAFVQEHASRPMPGAPQDSSASAATSPSSPKVKLPKTKAVALANEQIRVALGALGPGVTLLVYEDTIETRATGSSLDVTLAINLPSTLGASLVAHAFVKSVADAVRAHLEKATGYGVAVHIVFDPLDTGGEADDHLKRLLPLVKKTRNASAIAFLEEAMRAPRGMSHSST